MCIKLLLPYYHVKLMAPSGRELGLVIDAYFMKFIKFTPRRLLLLFPEKVLRYESIGGALNTVGPSQKVKEILELIKETYREVKNAKVPSISSVIMRSKLTLTAPPKRLIFRGEDEIRGALLIFSKVFGNEVEELEVITHRLAHIPIELYLKKHPIYKFRELIINAPRPIGTSYRFLYYRDEGFRYALNNLLNIYQGSR